jgi:hypothetical protein
MPLTNRPFICTTLQFAGMGGFFTALLLTSEICRQAPMPFLAFLPNQLGLPASSSSSNSRARSAIVE